MTLPHLTQWPLWSWASVARFASQSDRWFCPQKLCSRSSPDHFVENVLKWLGAFDLQNCERITVVWVCFSAVQGGSRDPRPPSCRLLLKKAALVQTVFKKTTDLCQSCNLPPDCSWRMCCISFGASFQSAYPLPRYNHNGWLGVKHQVTYILLHITYLLLTIRITLRRQLSYMSRTAFR